MNPVEEMTLDELKDCLCADAEGKVESCLSCATQCKFGKRIEELHKEETSVEPTKQNTKVTKGVYSYLQACASGDPVSWYREHGFAKNTIYASRHSYGEMTPEEAKRKLEEIGAEVDFDSLSSVSRSYAMQNARGVRTRNAKIMYLRAMASGDAKGYYKEHGYGRDSLWVFMRRNNLTYLSPDEAKRQLEELGVEIENAASQNHPTTQNIVTAVNEYKRKENNNMKPPLLDEISIPEMQRMRDEEGLSNREIAARIGVAYQTVLKYLGPQTNDIKRRRFVIPQETTPPIPTIPTWNPEDWEAAETIHKLKGIYMHYEVNSTTNEVDIVLIDGHPLGKLDKADLMKCIDELSRVAVLIK